MDRLWANKPCEGLDASAKNGHGSGAGANEAKAKVNKL